MRACDWGQGGWGGAMLWLISKEMSHILSRVTGAPLPCKVTATLSAALPWWAGFHNGQSQLYQHTSNHYRLPRGSTWLLQFWLVDKEL